MIAAREKKQRTVPRTENMNISSKLAFWKIG